MADGAWSVSGCGRNDVYWYGVPGQGCYYWTARFGQYFVGGVVFQSFRNQGYECGQLGAPVKPYQFLSEFGQNGQWFEHGAILGNGAIKPGDYGQTTGRLMDADIDPVADGHSEPANPPAPPAPRPHKQKEHHEDFIPK